MVDVLAAAAKINSFRGSSSTTTTVIMPKKTPPKSGSIPSKNMASHASLPSIVVRPMSKNLRRSSSSSSSNNREVREDDPEGEERDEDDIIDVENEKQADNNSTTTTLVIEEQQQQQQPERRSKVVESDDGDNDPRGATVQADQVNEGKVDDNNDNVDDEEEEDQPQDLSLKKIDRECQIRLCCDNTNTSINNISGRKNEENQTMRESIKSNTTTTTTMNDDVAGIGKTSSNTNNIQNPAADLDQFLLQLRSMFWVAKQLILGKFLGANSVHSLTLFFCVQHNF